MTFTFLLIVAAAIFSGLLSLFWFIRTILVAFDRFPATNSGGLKLILAVSLMSTACLAFIRLAMSTAEHL